MKRYQIKDVWPSDKFTGGHILCYMTLYKTNIIDNINISMNPKQICLQYTSDYTLSESRKYLSILYKDIVNKNTQNPVYTYRTLEK